MNKYNIKVNGISYEVEVEEVEGDFSNNLAPIAVTKEALIKTQTSPKTEVKNTATTGEKIESPMPGVVLKVNVNAGDEVKSGQVMFILEAMKMENEIMAPHDGKITELRVKNGASVNTGDILAVIQ